MIDYSAIRPVIRAQVAAVSELPLDAIRWRDQARPYASSDQLVLLKVKSPTTTGVDWFSYDVVEGALETTQKGIRVVVLNVRCESYRQDDSSFAMATLSLIRGRLRRASVQEAFNAVGLALASFEPTIDLDLEVNDRQYSLAEFDVRLNYAVNDVDLGDTGGYIERVDYTGTIDNAGEDITVMGTVDATE